MMEEVRSRNKKRRRLRNFENRRHFTMTFSVLDQLKALTKIVADTGDFESISVYSPQDATTNPSLIKSASESSQYQHIVSQALEYAKSLDEKCSCKRLTLTLEKLSVLFGAEILRIVPGRVSTEVEARYSFDVKETVESAKRIVALYEKEGFTKDRILIKISGTWEGIQAAKILESQHRIHCNVTLIFSLVQAVACGQAGVTLISPFVGRILDWHKKQNPNQSFTGETDPGVISVKTIYNYFKQRNFNTIVMGASFRNTDEVIALAGLDALTISPKLLEQLSNDKKVIETQCSPSIAGATPKILLCQECPSLEVVDEEEFRWLLNEDPMATEKLAEGIRSFHKDSSSLRKYLEDKLSTA